MVRIAKQEQPSEQDVLLGEVTAFLRLKKTIADLTKESNAMRDRLSSKIDRDGEEDESGSRWLALPDDGVEGVAALKRERRVSRVLDENVADEILTAKKLSTRCYRLEPVLDEDEIMACLVEGLLTEDDVSAMYPQKVTWALVTPKK